MARVCNFRPAVHNAGHHDSDGDPTVRSDHQETVNRLKNIIFIIGCENIQLQRNLVQSWGGPRAGHVKISIIFLMGCEKNQLQRTFF